MFFRYVHPHGPGFDCPLGVLRWGPCPFRKWRQRRGCCLTLRNSKGRNTSDVRWKIRQRIIQFCRCKWKSGLTFLDAVKVLYFTIKIDFAFLKQLIYFVRINCCVHTGRGGRVVPNSIIFASKCCEKE